MRGEIQRFTMAMLATAATLLVSAGVAFAFENRRSRSSSTRRRLFVPLHVSSWDVGAHVSPGAKDEIAFGES
jgi:hypothetical protein